MPCSIIFRQVHISDLRWLSHPDAFVSATAVSSPPLYSHNFTQTGFSVNQFSCMSLTLTDEIILVQISVPVQFGVNSQHCHVCRLAAFMSAAIKAAAAGAVAVLCTESTTQAAQIHIFYLAALGGGDVLSSQMVNWWRKCPHPTHN